MCDAKGGGVAKRPGAKGAKGKAAKGGKGGKRK